MPSKRANRLPLLGILCLALVIIVLAALFIWLRNGEGEGQKAEEQGGGEGGRRGEGEGGGGKTKDEVARTTPKTEGTSTSRSRSSTSEPEQLEAEEGETEQEQQQQGDVDRLETQRGQDGTHAAACPLGEWTRREPTDCVGEQEGGGEGEIQVPNPLEWLRPLEYSLNLSLSSDNPHSSKGFALVGRLSILAELRRESSLIPLHCGAQVEGVEEVLRLWSCSSSGSPICVRSVRRLPGADLLLFRLARPLPSGSLLRIQFSRLRVPLSAPNPALLVQIPSPWERDRSWMIASQFPLSDGIRMVIPSVDDPGARAVFRLCLAHPKQTFARANSPLARTLAADPSALWSCFRDSPPLPPSQFAFALFRNLRPVTLPSASSSPVELFIGAHLNPADYGWAIEKSRKTMERMRQLTGTEYPLDKMTLISSPLPTGHDAVGGLGLALVRDSWMDYPKFVHTHELLVGQLVRQWTANVLNACDRCFQQGLGLYLEWVVGAELSSDPEGEFQRRFGESRKKLMDAEGQNWCPDRVAVVLHMLDRAFGPRNTTQFLAKSFRQLAWKSRCTPMDELSKLYRLSTGSPEAHRVFNSFLLLSASSIPLVHIRVHPQLSVLRLSQPSALSVPVELVDDTLKRTRLVLNSTRMDVPLVVSSFAVAQPTSLARFVYNVENYEKLAKCGGGQGTTDREEGGGCQAVGRAALQSTWEDLCWALFKGHLGSAADAVPASPHRWLSLFRSLSAQGVVRGDCACCMQSKAEAMRGHCRWTWSDKCAGIEMLMRGEEGKE